MGADNPRIDDLRRRLDKEPASIAFAQLAEEYRRAGDVQECVRVCRAGLAQHPGYLSARLTLGRALMELGRLDEAQTEFAQVLQGAPDNLVGLKSMADLRQRRGATPPVDFTPEDLTDEIPPLPDVTPPPLPAPTEIDVAPTSVEVASTSIDVAPTTVDNREDVRAAVAALNEAFGMRPTDRALGELEDWLAAIVADRDERAKGRSV